MRPDNLQTKIFPAQIKTIDAKEGILEAIVSVFNNVDAARERVIPGFFADSLKRKLPKGVWMHDWTQPVAKTLDARELQPGDALLPQEIKEFGGLYVKGQFNLGTQRGREAFSDLDFGTVDEFSIGYCTLEDAMDSKTGVRDLIKGELYEWSPVLVGCNPATALLDVKAAQPSSTTPGGNAQPSPTSPAGHARPSPTSPDRLPVTQERKMIKPETKDVAIGGIQVKSQYLGEYVEAEMTAAAIRTLQSALTYNVVYDLIYGSWEWDDDAEMYVRSNLPMDDAVEQLTNACNEFRDILVATYRALMALGGDKAMAEAKSLRAMIDDPKSLNGSSPAGETFAKQAERVLADAKDLVSRAATIKELRFKEGRKLSQATRDRLSGHAETLKSVACNIEDLLSEAEPPADETQDKSAKTGDDPEPRGAASPEAKSADAPDASEDAANAAYARFLELSASTIGIDV